MRTVKQLLTCHGTCRLKRKFQSTKSSMESLVSNNRNGVTLNFKKEYHPFGILHGYSKWCLMWDTHMKNIRGVEFIAFNQFSWWNLEFSTTYLPNTCQSSARMCFHQNCHRLHLRLYITYIPRTMWMCLCSFGGFCFCLAILKGNGTHFAKRTTSNDVSTNIQFIGFIPVVSRHYPCWPWIGWQWVLQNNTVIMKG